MTTNRDTEAIMQTYFDTFATGDTEAIARLHAEEGQFWLHLDGEPAVGRAAIAGAFDELFEQWPDFGFDIYRTFVGPNHWVLDWALTSTLTRPDGTTSPVRFDLIDLVTVDEDGLVARKDTFVDLPQAQRAIAPI